MSKRQVVFCVLAALSAAAVMGSTVAQPLLAARQPQGLEAWGYLCVARVFAVGGGIVFLFAAVHPLSPLHRLMGDGFRQWLRAALGPHSYGPAWSGGRLRLVARRQQPADLRGRRLTEHGIAMLSIALAVVAMQRDITGLAMPWLPWAAAPIYILNAALLLAAEALIRRDNKRRA